MKFRTFGKLGINVSALGFGAMRLPARSADPSEGRLSPDIVEEEAIEMIRYAIDHGVNYVDTAYVYHHGQSEVLVGKALADGYREKVFLATKLPTWSVRRPEDFDKYLDRQLEKLRTSCIDFYLIHSLHKGTWKNNVLKNDLFSRAQKAKKDGKIKYLGFSFHDDFNTFQEIIDGYDQWDFCQIQLNYMDIDFQAGLKGLRYAAKQGLGVVIMEPLLGGRLARAPRDVQKIMDESGVSRLPADWAFQYLWNLPEVSVVLSGMSSLVQVKENLAFADRSGAGSLSEKELAVIDRIREAYKKKAAIPCTACGYCLPCPQSIDIPKNFAIYNQAVIYDDYDIAKISYNNFFEPEQRAENCLACGACETKCPQKIKISSWMPKVKDALLKE